MAWPKSQKKNKILPRKFSQTSEFSFLRILIKIRQKGVGLSRQRQVASLFSRPRTKSSESNR